MPLDQPLSLWESEMIDEPYFVYHHSLTTILQWSLTDDVLIQILRYGGYALFRQYIRTSEDRNSVASITLSINFFRLLEKALMEYYQTSEFSRNDVQFLANIADNLFLLYPQVYTQCTMLAYMTEVKKWRVFNRSKKWWRSFATAQQHYNLQLLSKQTDKYPEVEVLKGQIMAQTEDNGISTETIVAVPVYAKEEYLEELVRSISTQWTEFTAVFFVNFFSQPWMELQTSSSVENLQWLIEKYKLSNGIILSYEFDQKVPLWRIRAAMVDAISQSCRSTLIDPIIVWFDADTYRLSPNYIASVRQAFDKDPSVTFTSGKVRWIDFDRSPSVWLSEMIMQLAFSYVVNPVSGAIFSPWPITSYRLVDYMVAKWYPRELIMAEDVWLGVKLNYSPWKKAIQLNEKVHINPRRGIAAMKDWYVFGDQWAISQEKQSFDHVEESSVSSVNFDFMDRVIFTIREGWILTLTEILLITEFINHNIRNNKSNFPKDNLPRFIPALIKFWKLNFPRSNYEMIEKDGGVLLEIKI